jgi:2-keto-4-pentenoate hydratase/2-oxohepta-3-ene-1,7-dioic acid hydratase in catechol pathway
LESRTRRELPQYPTLFAKFPDTLTGSASAREDQPFLKDGQDVTVTIEGIGSCRNEFYAEAEAPGRY